MKTTLAIIDKAVREHGKPAVAFSGGTDSRVLLDIVCTRTRHKPIVVYADSQMDYPETQDFIQRICDQYGVPLLVARATRTPLEQWNRSGWPMLGKYNARLWNREHKDMGYRLNVTLCCRNMKIGPARTLLRQNRIFLQLTGQRGVEDDELRGLRAIKDGAIKYVKQDKMTVCNPLIGWTNAMIRRYAQQNKLEMHPAKARGATTIGCIFCGGGAQFTTSTFRILRTSQPAEWKRLMVGMRAGEIVLSMKYGRSLKDIRAAVDKLGGLEVLAKERPHVFDFVTHNPQAISNRDE